MNRALYDRLDYGVEVCGTDLSILIRLTRFQDVESAAGGRIAVTSEKSKVLMARMR